MGYGSCEHSQSIASSFKSSVALARPVFDTEASAEGMRTSTLSQAWKKDPAGPLATYAVGGYF